MKEGWMNRQKKEDIRGPPVPWTWFTRRTQMVYHYYNYYCGCS